MAPPPLPRETDALLASQPPLLPPSTVVSIKTIWTKATTSNKILMAIGATSAAIAGYASASTFVLYGRAFDAMARSTLVGVDEILWSYVTLTAMEWVGTWLQFLTWSRVASHITEQDHKEDEVDEAANNRETEVAYIESLGHACNQASLGLTAMVITIRYGRDCLLVIFIVTCFALVMMMPIAFHKFWKATRTANTAGDGTTTSTPTVEKSREKKMKQLEAEVDNVWTHARALRMMDATNAAVSKIQCLLDDPVLVKKSRGGIVAVFLALFPFVVLLLYTSWRIHSSPNGNGDGGVIGNPVARIAVVFIAVFATVSSLQRAWTIFQNQDPMTTQQSPDDSQKKKKNEPLAVASDNEKDRAIQWIQALSRPHKRSSVEVAGSSLVTTCGYLTMALVVAYSCSWLLMTPYQSGDHSTTIMENAWKLATAILGSALLIGVTWEYRIAAQVALAKRVGDTIVTKVLTAHLQQGPDSEDSDSDSENSVSGSSLMEDASMIGMSASSLTEPKHMNVIIMGSLCVVLAVAIDPWFALATIVETPLTLIGYAVHMKTNKALYQSLSKTPQPTWLVAIADSLLRSLLSVSTCAAAVVMVYLQTKWIAQGSSTLLSVLCIKCLSTFGFLVAHMDRFEIGFFIQPKSIAAAVVFLKIADTERASSRQSLPNTVCSMEGDALWIKKLEGESVQLQAKPGQVVVISVASDKDVRLVSSQLLQGSPAAALGSVAMVIDNDPVRLPGSVLENITLAMPSASLDDTKKAARDAGVTSEEEQLLHTNDWPLDLQQRIVIARVLLRQPAVLILEDNTAATVVQINLVDVVDIIRHRLPLCKVLAVTTNERQGGWSALHQET